MVSWEKPWCKNQTWSKAWKKSDGKQQLEPDNPRTSWETEEWKGMNHKNDTWKTIILTHHD
jgi:hypothetical protein